MLGRSHSTWLEARRRASSLLPMSGVAVISSRSLPRMLCRITSAARRMPGLMLTRPTQLPWRSSLSIPNSALKSLRSTATARTPCFLASSSMGWRKYLLVTTVPLLAFSSTLSSSSIGTTSTGTLMLGSSSSAISIEAPMSSLGVLTSTRAPQRRRQSISRVSSSRVCCRVQPALSRPSTHLRTSRSRSVTPRLRIWGGVRISRGFC